MFTPAEHEQMEAQLGAVHDGIHAAHYLTRHLGAHPQDAPAVAELLRFFFPLYGKHVEGVFYLLDLEGKTRDTVHRLSREHTTLAGKKALASVRYAPVRTRLEALRQLRPASVSLRTGARLLTGVQEAIATFDADLPYLDPHLPETQALPGFTRQFVPMIGPHGDYRRYGRHLRHLIHTNNVGWEHQVRAAVLRPDYIPTLVLNANNLGRLGRYAVICLGLPVGIEHPEITDDVQTMLDAGTTERGRHFFRILLAGEILLNIDHLPNEATGDFSTDAFGRKVIRGGSYDALKELNQLCDYLLKRPDLPEDVRALIRAVDVAANKWSFIDGGEWSTLAIRNYKTTGRVDRKKAMENG
jgi:hypothetical protein